MKSREDIEPRRPPGRPKLTCDEQQRRHILEMTGKLLQEIGYSKATTDLIAARAGVSKRTLYRLFPSKAALFREFIVSHRRSMVALPGAYDDMPLQDALVKIFYVDLSGDEDQKRLTLLRTIISESEKDPEFRSFALALGRDQSRELLRDWLASQVRLGRLRINNVDMASNILMDMMFGYMDITTVGEAAKNRATTREAYLRQAITIFLKGTEKIIDDDA